MPRSGAGLEDLIERIRRVNPTGRALPAREERARYAEKARLQSLLIERYPAEVRARAHDDMPGGVSLSVPRLRASAAHAVLEALSDRARALVEEQLRLDAASRDTVVARAPAAGAAPPGEDPQLTHAARALAEYDFGCAEAALSSLGADAAAEHAERLRALGAERTMAGQEEHIGLAVVEHRDPADVRRGSRCSAGPSRGDVMGLLPPMPL